MFSEHFFIVHVVIIEATSDFRWNLKKYLSSSLLVAACCSIPAMGAATKYLGASPQMSAYLTGVNEFAPGSDAIITLKSAEQRGQFHGIFKRHRPPAGCSPDNGKTRNDWAWFRWRTDHY